MPELNQLPASLRRQAEWRHLGPARVPAMIVQPPDVAHAPPPWPTLVWMHGRTVTKEIDPGRFLRLMRRGIASVSLDLPGHGERFDPALHEPERTLEVVERMIDELDGVVEALDRDGRFDPARLALGGMSAGGMVTLARLCRPHPFRAAAVEATTGAWTWQRDRAMFDPARVERLNPITHLDEWREIPLFGLHARHDEWVACAGQEEFFETLRSRATRPESIELHVYEERTGAPFEHAGFGRLGADAKDRLAMFLERELES